MANLFTSTNSQVVRLLLNTLQKYYYQNAPLLKVSTQIITVFWKGIMEFFYKGSTGLRNAFGFRVLQSSKAHGVALVPKFRQKFRKNKLRNVLHFVTTENQGKGCK